MSSEMSVGGGTFVSRDTAKTWRLISSEKYKFLLSLPQGDILAATDSSGLRLFSVDGDSIGPCNEGLTTLNILTLELGDDGYVYAGTDDGVWRRPLSEIVTSTEEISPTFPEDFIIAQNYPNPFNPTTTLEYSLSHAGHVTLKVYNVLGEEVAALVDGEQAAGAFTTTWDASDLPSGVYFYRLTAGEYVQTRKMVLMR